MHKIEGLIGVAEAARVKGTLCVCVCLINKGTENDVKEGSQEMYGPGLY